MGTLLKVRFIQVSGLFWVRFIRVSGLFWVRFIQVSGLFWVRFRQVSMYFNLIIDENVIPFCEIGICHFLITFMCLFFFLMEKLTFP
jgi:hypothetical protein